jgi:hypothetical protein
MAERVLATPQLRGGRARNRHKFNFFPAGNEPSAEMKEAPGIASFQAAGLRDAISQSAGLG